MRPIMGNQRQKQTTKSKFIVKRFISGNKAFFIEIIKAYFSRKHLCKRLLGDKILFRNLIKIDRRELI